jgi:hypothetical protein
MQKARDLLEFDIHVQSQRVCAGSTGQFLVGLQLLVPETVKRVPVQIVPVIDVSNSMAEHLSLLKDGLVVVAEDQEVLGNTDDFALVTFGFKAKLMCHSEGLGRMSGRRREGIISGIRKMRTSGMTNLHAGLMMGLEEVKNGDGRFAFILLMTDGIASAGKVQPCEILDDVRRELETIDEMGCHLAIYTMGLGHEHNSTLLRQIAEAGHGQYNYVEGGDTVELISKIHEWLAMFNQLRATEVKISMVPRQTIVSPEGVAVTGMQEITFTPSPDSQDQDISASPSKPAKRTSVIFGDTFAGTSYQKLISLDVTTGEKAKGEKEIATFKLNYRDAITDEEHTLSLSAKIWVAPPNKSLEPSMAVIPSEVIPRPVSIPKNERVNFAMQKQLASDMIRNAAIRMHRYCVIAEKEIRLSGTTDSPIVQRSKAALATWEQLLESLSDVISRDMDLTFQMEQLKKMEILRAEGRLDECRAMANNFHQRPATNTISRQKSLANLLLNALSRQGTKKGKGTKETPSDSRLAAKLSEKMAAIEAGEANPDIVALEERLAHKKKLVSQDTFQSSELARSLHEFHHRREQLLKMAGVSWFGELPTPQTAMDGQEHKGDELITAFRRQKRREPALRERSPRPTVTEL